MAFRLSTVRFNGFDRLGLRWSVIPRHVRIVDVGPRDGLQNELKIVSTEDKVHLIKKLADAGLSGIEVTSFVSPKWVPQMSDHEAVARSIVSLKSKAAFPVLVPNLRGFEKARECGVQEIAVFTAATDSFTLHNTNCTLEESLQNCFKVIKESNATKGMRVRGYISCALGCPYDGAVDSKKIINLIRQLLDSGCYEISLADTIGVATPGSTDRLLRAIAEYDTNLLHSLAMHFHDTKKQGLANALTALQYGIHTFDSSIAGLGGCPYAPGATGNLATESLFYMLDGMGIQTGVDGQKLKEAAIFAKQIIQQ